MLAQILINLGQKLKEDLKIESSKLSNNTDFTLH